MDPTRPAWERIEAFGRLVAGDPTLVPLDQAALALASVLTGGVDAGAALTTLDGLAVSCPERTFDGLRRHLFDHEGFNGDRTHYDDPSNSYLDRVLTRRRGLPILLATVMLEVGRRAGIAVIGIGMPMHFLVGDARDPHALVDPFTGAALDRDAAHQHFDRLSEGRIPWDEHHLDPVSPRAMVARMLTNLRASFARRGDTLRLALIARLADHVPELGGEPVGAARAGAVFN